MEMTDLYNNKIKSAVLRLIPTGLNAPPQSSIKSHFEMFNGRDFSLLKRTVLSELYYSKGVNQSDSSGYIGCKAGG